MTDKELIQALRCCTCRPDRDKCAEECVFYKGSDVEGCVPDMGVTVSNRLEALLAENEHLREATKMMPRWRSVSEPPKEYGEKKCFIVCVENDPEYPEYPESFIGIYNGRCWGDGMFSFPVTHWMELPKPFSTEGWSE